VPTLPAHLVATPVLERLAGTRSGVVLGAGATAAWVDLDGFVVAITTREVPLLPNAVALAAGSTGTVGSQSFQRSGVVQGSAARFAPGRIDLGTLRVSWDPTVPPAWDPTVPPPVGSAIEAVANRGAALLRAVGIAPVPDRKPPVDSPERPSPESATLPLREPQQPGVAFGGAPHPEPVVLVRELARVGLATAADPEGAAGLVLLLRAVRERDPESAAAGARELLGRGPGLTPEGDDLLAAVAGTLAVLGPATGLDGSGRDALVGALAPRPGRTTALSATLLELAARGMLAEPAGRLLDLGPGAEAAWPVALARLERLGHGSGRAYAAGIAAAASLLAAGSPVG
jgi:Protein of unknown function (DUF2877)